MTYPFASLPENLAAFCAVLRRDLHVDVGPRELMDAAHALELSEITSERAVRDTLRPILSKTVDDARAFDSAFDRFFRRRDGPAPGAPAGGLDATPGGAGGPSGDVSTTKPSDLETARADSGEHVGDQASVHELEEPAGGETATLLRASYSPLEGEGGPLVLDPPAREWVEAAAALVRRTQAGTSRRWRPALQGPRFDFRRTLRTSLHTGGEPVRPQWRARPRRNPRFVLLIDGSRSMGASAIPALHVAAALSAVRPGTETFTFSTRLRRVTHDVRRVAGGERRTLQLHDAWGGGTMIGACLDDFVRRFGERLLGRETVVIIASDGLDIGAPDLLRQAMARLARRSAAVVWLNPLMATPGYEPTAVGMRLARPYVTVLAVVNEPGGLRTLARGLRLRLS